MKPPFYVKVYLLALALRLIPVIFTRQLGIGLDDMFQYDMLARSLALGNGYKWYANDDLKLLEPYIQFDTNSFPSYDPLTGISTSFRGPLYPFFLATVYVFSGTGFSRFFWARLAQAVLLGAPLAPLTYLLSRRLFPEREKMAVYSSLIVAVYPLMLLYPLGLATENLFFLLVLVSFVFLLDVVSQPSNGNLLLAGCLLGLACLTRSVILLFAVAVAIYLFRLFRIRGLLFALGLLLVIGPWVARNSILHQRLTGIETSLGYNLYLGYHPSGDGSFVFGPSLDLLTIMDDFSRDQTGTTKAIEFIRARPDRFLPLAIDRLGYFFGLEKRVLMYFYSNNMLGFLPPPILIFGLIVLLSPFVVVCLLAVFSLPVLGWNRGTQLMCLLFGAYLLPHVLILSEDRFHLVLVPFLAVLSARGFQFLSSKSGWGRVNQGRILLAAGLIFLLIINWGFELSRDSTKIARLLGPHGNQTFAPY